MLHNRPDNTKIANTLIALMVCAVLFIVGLFVFYPYHPTDYATISGTRVITTNQVTHEATGFGTGSARVDSQITLKIPQGQAQEVYQYLKNKYSGKSNIMKDQFPSININGQPQDDMSIFTDEYYDTPKLDLYNNQNSTRHRTRVNTTNPEDRKSGRELVQVKVTPPGKFDIRTELKFEVKPPKNAQPGGDDNHPLLHLVKSDQRIDFKNVFKDAGLDPFTLKKIFTIRQTRSRVYINMDTQNIMSFSVDEGGAGILWASAQFSSVDVGLVEVAYTEAGAQKREMMWNIRDALVKDLKKQFPDLIVNNDSKYGIILDALIQKIHVIPLLIKWRFL